jgi:hypothetical protein
MSLSDPSTLVAVLALASVIVLAAVVVVLALRLRRLAEGQRRAFEGGEVDIIATLARHRHRLDELAAELDASRTHTREVEGKAARAVSRIGVVRYDAFDDVGGQLSFSAALLDEHADGVVLTSITGRTGGRTYLKSVTNGESTSTLSDEESAAVAAARERQRGEQIAEQGKRRWRQR